MVHEHKGEHVSQWLAISSIASKIGCTPETLHLWVWRTERDQGKRAKLTTDEREGSKRWSAGTGSFAKRMTFFARRRRILMAWMPPPGGIAMYPLPTLCGPREGATSMPQVAIIGVDLAKRVFQLHGAAADGSVLFRRKLTRERFLSFLASQPPCVVAMEACATAHGWGREIERVGHTVRLIPPLYVKPFVKRHKNDAADAEAIVEAASRPTMRFVCQAPSWKGLIHSWCTRRGQHARRRLGALATCGGMPQQG